VLRYLAVAASVGLYIGFGFAFRPDPNTYVLLGIPITLLFQVLVARRPLRELWLEPGRPLRLDRVAARWLPLFLVGPALVLWRAAQSGRTPVLVYAVLAVGGAFCAAMTFRVLRARELREPGLLLALTVPIGPLRLVLQQTVAGAGSPRRSSSSR